MLVYYAICFCNQNTKNWLPAKPTDMFGMVAPLGAVDDNDVDLVKMGLVYVAVLVLI